ncbi:uncharacterized protein LOC126554641 [Aphis gossypii]|uniref:uncharacterized protein LOC126554641 n=1 Tax=Aphis gossypii TaxID=80765 RepID=UPI0021590013|nr:uncharacterized protein LOC126554641 [Aphis gossypii]
MKIHLIKACKNTPLQVKEELSDKKVPVLTAETNIIQRDLYQPSTSQSLSFVRESTPLSQSQNDSMPADLSMYVPDQTIIRQIEKKKSKVRDLLQGKEKIDTLLARAIFTSGIPLSIVEHKSWKQLFYTIRPSYKLPNRKTLSTTLLEKEFLLQKFKVENKIAESKCLSIQCDGWSNLRQEGIINFVITTPEPFFVDFIDTDGKRHTAEYLASQIITVINKYNPKKFVAFISDNASNIVKAAEIVQNKFEHMLMLTCVCHTLNLLVKDIFKCDQLQTFDTKVVSIIKTIKYSQRLSHKIRKISKEKNINVFVQLPVKTRWQSHLICYKNLFKLKQVLKLVAIDEDVAILFKDHIYTILLESFWKNVDSMIQLIEPIVNAITLLEGDKPIIHKVYPTVKNLKLRLIEVVEEIDLEDLNDKKTF